jgi:hypothetical protein
VLQSTLAGGANENFRAGNRETKAEMAGGGGHSEFKANLGYIMRFCLKNLKTTPSPILPNKSAFNLHKYYQ